MKNLIELNKSFIDISLVTNRTKKRYLDNLTEFNEYLAEKLQISCCDVNLMKVFSLENYEGNLICFKPISAELVDEYFYENIKKGSYWLFCNRNTLGSFFRYLQRNYNFTNVMNNINFDIKEYIPKYAERKSLSRHDILRFLQSILNYSKDLERDLLLFVLLISTGCRVSEIINIKIEDIDFDNDMINIWISKTKKEMNIVLRKGIGQSIKDYCETRKVNNHNYLF